MTNRERLLTLLNIEIPDTWEEVIPAIKWPAILKASKVEGINFPFSIE